MTTVEDGGEPRTPIEDFGKEPIPFLVPNISDAPIAGMAMCVGRDNSFVFAIQF